MPEFSRREFLCTAAAAAGTAALARAEVSAHRPNILFLLTDDQRWDSLGCMGNTIIQTPNIDRIAAEGIRFNNCFATTAICMASRASILTGMYTTTHGIGEFTKPLPPDLLAQTYPQILRREGYHVGFIGKWGLGGEMPAASFDYWDGFPDQGNYFQEVNGQTRHLESLLGESAVKAISEAPADKPFCVAVSFKAPHAQDGDPRQYLYDPVLEDLYQDVEIPVPSTANEEAFRALPEFIQHSEGRERWKLRFTSPEQFQQSIKGYYRLVTGVDRAVGKILEALQAKGELDNTVIMFTSDNGKLNGEHGLAGKWIMYEESIRLPMILRDPRMDPALRGTAVDAMALNIDVAPTLLDAAGLKAPADMQGRSLLPFTTVQSPTDWRTEFFYEHHFGSKGREVRIPACEGVRTTDWKYIRYVDEEPLYEVLFHIAGDAREMANLATSPEHEQELQKMRAKWRAWREKIKPLV